MRSKSILVLVIVCMMAVANIASATIVQGINIDFVTIGNAGNPGDTRTDYPDSAAPYGCGSVDYEYQIGKYEVTNGQWDAFVLAAGAPSGNPSYAYDESAYWTGTNKPTNEVSWYEAAQFCNYLTSGDKSQGVYQFSGNNTNPGDFLGIDRTSAQAAYGTIYFLPTENEWYKAAYYTGSGYSTYANGTDVAPIAGDDTNYDFVIGQPWDVGTGTMEQNGTFDMMGNVWEWNETLIGSYRGFRGGSCIASYRSTIRSSYRNSIYPSYEHGTVGFRVASIPEPAVIEVDVDIKPGSCPNPVDVKSKGVLPIAILGTADVNVIDIVIASIRLADPNVAPIRNNYEDVAAPVFDANDCNCTTDGPDGFLDLTLKFETQRIVEAIGDVNHGDILTLMLTGVLFDETPIEGADCVLIRGKHKSLNKADINKDGVVDTVDFAIFAQNWLQSSIVDD